MQQEKIQRSFMFRKEVVSKEIAEILQLQSSQLLQFLALMGHLYHKYLEKESRKHRLQTFLRNYHKLILVSSNRRSSMATNNFALHYILLNSYQLLRYKQEDECRVVLKKAHNYMDGPSVDSVLLAIALNNLATLYLIKKRYYKGLQMALKTIEIMERHLYDLKKGGRKKRIIEDSVILINAFVLSKKFLDNIRRLNTRKFYNQLDHRICEIGHRYALKFLGKDSKFSHCLKSQPRERDFQPPIVLQPPPLSYRSQAEHKILEQLSQIQGFLLSNPSPRSPEVEVNKSSVIFVPLIEEEDIEGQEIFIENLSLCGWQGKLKITKKIERIAEDKDYFGELSLYFEKSKRILAKQLNEEQVEKLITQLNFRDTMPYEKNLNNSLETQLINFCIKPFLLIEGEPKKEKLIINPKSLGIIPPFAHKFCAQDCLVFVNHIHFGVLRASICPTMQGDSLYLDLYLNQATLDKLLEFETAALPCVQRVYKQYAEFVELESNLLEVLPLKSQCKVKDTKMLLQKLNLLLPQFQAFIYQQQQNNSTQLNQVISTNSRPFFFSFEQSQESDKGCFYYLNFQSSIKAVNVYMQNNFTSYGVNETIKAKGTTFYPPKQIVKELGVRYAEFKPFMLFLFSIICKKFGLKIYEEELYSDDEDNFSENAIIETNLKTSIYKIRTIIDQVHEGPVILTIQNLQLPHSVLLGFKVMAYDPGSMNSQGFFIGVTPGFWELPKAVLQKIEDDNESENSENPEQKGDKEYFLTPWLEEFGFKLLLKQFTVQNGKIILKSNPNSHINFIMLETLLHMIFH